MHRMMDGPSTRKASLSSLSSSLEAEQAQKVAEHLGFEDDELTALVESLSAQPMRGSDSAVHNDPTIYRLHEALSVYGPALKALIHEEFGDGIMSAINFKVDFSR